MNKKIIIQVRLDPVRLVVAKIEGTPEHIQQNLDDVVEQLREFCKHLILGFKIEFHTDRHYLDFRRFRDGSDFVEYDQLDSWLLATLHRYT